MCFTVESLDMVVGFNTFRAFEALETIFGWVKIYIACGVDCQIVRITDGCRG
jgi:hypothetical protein